MGRMDWPIFPGVFPCETEFLVLVPLSLCVCVFLVRVRGGVVASCPRCLRSSLWHDGFCFPQIGFQSSPGARN